MFIHVCIRFQPTQEEREMYKNYTGDKKQLPLADSFLLKVYIHIIIFVEILHVCILSTYI